MIERKQVHLTHEELQERLAYWQPLLHLGQWDIKVRIARVFDFPNTNTQGRCEWTIERHEALIRILDPADWDPAIIYPQDMETTLVHELLHLHAAPFDTFESETPNNAALEQLIHHVAYALTHLERTA